MCGFQGTQKPYTISGDTGERDPPVPIPNTEVKPFSADGTWLETTWESRNVAGFHKEKASDDVWGFFFVHPVRSFFQIVFKPTSNIVLG